MTPQLHTESCDNHAYSDVPLVPQDSDRLASQLGAEWQMIDYSYLRWEKKFPDFATALAAVNQIGALAESENHHPDITLKWGYVGLKVLTHTINGLSRNDFILATKIDRLIV